MKSLLELIRRPLLYTCIASPAFLFSVLLLPNTGFADISIPAKCLSAPTNLEIDEIPAAVSDFTRIAALSQHNGKYEAAFVCSKALLEMVEANSDTSIADKISAVSLRTDILKKQNRLDGLIEVYILGLEMIIADGGDDELEIAIMVSSLSDFLYIRRDPRAFSSYYAMSKMGACYPIFQSINEIHLQRKNETAAWHNAKLFPLPTNETCPTASYFLALARSTRTNN